MSLHRRAYRPLSLLATVSVVLLLVLGFGATVADAAPDGPAGPADQAASRNGPTASGHGTAASPRRGPTDQAGTNGATRRPTASARGRADANASARGRADANASARGRAEANVTARLGPGANALSGDTASPSDRHTRADTRARGQARSNANARAGANPNAASPPRANADAEARTATSAPPPGSSAPSGPADIQEDAGTTSGETGGTDPRAAQATDGESSRNRDATPGPSGEPDEVTSRALATDGPASPTRSRALEPRAGAQGSGTPGDAFEVEALLAPEEELEPRSTADEDVVARAAPFEPPGGAAGRAVDTVLSPVRDFGVPAFLLAILAAYLAFQRRLDRGMLPMLPTSGFASTPDGDRHVRYEL